MIKFKEPKLETELKTVHPELLKLITWVSYWVFNKWQKDVIITGLGRTRAESIALYIHQLNPKTGKLYTPDEVEVSVHEVKPCRGADLRSSEYSHDDCLSLQYAINTNWIYDTDRIEKKCCKYHSVGKNVFHFHLQCSDKTKLIV